MTKTYPRARIKAKDEDEFRRWQKLIEKIRQRREKERPKDDRVILGPPC